MKKKFIIIYILFLMLSFIPRINAGVKCNASIPISEKSQASPAGFQTTLPVCGRLHFVKYVDYGTRDTYPEAKAIGEELVKKYSASVDNKSVFTSFVPRCDDPKAYIVNKTTAYGYYSASTETKWSCIKCADYKTKKACGNASVTNAVGTVRNPCEWIDPPSPGGAETQGGGQGALNMSASIAANPGGCFRKSDIKNTEYYKYCSYSGLNYSCPRGGSLANERQEWNPAGYYYTMYDCKVTRTGTHYNCAKDDYYYDGASGGCKKVTGATAHHKTNQNNFVNRDQNKVKEGMQSDCMTHLGLPLLDCPTNEMELDYTFYCPLYRCDVWDETFYACTPSFRVPNTNTPVYCVNPSNSFAGKYLEDTSFSAVNCANSYNTVDCGYANILIEGKYSDLPEKAVELAMRLWGIHTGRSGFGGTGLSNKKGATCGDNVYYMTRGGNVYNVYRQTYNYAMSRWFNYLSEHINPGSSGSTYGIACSAINVTNKGTDKENRIIADSTKYGVACGPTATQSYAIGLLLNTIIGNKDMQSHLSELYGGGKSVEPTNAAFYENYFEDTEHSMVVVEYAKEFEEVFESTTKKEIDCNDAKKNNPELYKKIAPYCQTRLTVYDQNGNEITTASGVVQKCKKDVGCYRKIEHIAICTQEETTSRPYKIKVTYRRTKVVRSVRKLIGCASSAQDMYYFVEWDKKADIDVTVTSSYDTDSKEFHVTTLTNCSGNFCTDTSLRGSVNNTCSNDDENYNGKFASSIKDPSLKCIMNFGNTGDKLMYDYSDYFHVNRNLCRVYCSDEVYYYIADKVKQNSARNFIYDISSEGYFNGTKPTAKLSSIVREKRTCVSQIFYDSNVNMFPNVKAIREKYGLTSSELGDGTAWKELLTALEKKGQSENSRGENIREIIYDLYNCNLLYSSNNDFGSIEGCSDGSCSDSANDRSSYTIRQPKDNKTGNVRRYIKSLYSESNNYGMAGDCLLNNSKNECVVHNPITNGTPNINGEPEKPSLGAPVQGYINNMSSTAPTVTTPFNKDSNSGEIKYCSGINCFKWTNKEEEYNYPAGGKNKVQKYSKVSTTGYSFRNVSKDTLIPTNDYAFFSISFDVGFYNSNKYIVEPDTGNVYNKAGHEDKNYIELEDYSYPVSKEAYNIPYLQSNDNVCFKRNIEEFDEKYSRCKVTQTFEKVTTFYRQLYDDEFSKAIEKAQSFTCYVDVLKPKPVEVIYRNVDPHNLFPNNGGNPESDSNWNTTVGKAAQSEIESSANLLSGGHDELLEYSIVLNPVQIKNLKEYNSQNGKNYVNDKIDPSSCDKNTENNGTYYLNCKSYFLREIKNENGKYGTMVYPEVLE